ncbi:hypothetical protein OSTOST_10215 [Ostertagia ostertagi]
MTIVTPQSRKPQVDKLISDQFLAAELDEVEKLLKEGEKIKEQGKKLDLSDLFADPVLVFQRKFGYRPYDSRITPVESVWTSVAAVGEGGHNFHHTFPQASDSDVFSNSVKPY